MKQMKSFVLASSAMLLMIGSIGVVALSCFCNDDQVSLSFFATTTTPCDDHTKTVQHGRTCCAHETETAEKEKNCCTNTTEKKGCCEDEFQHIKVKLDFFSKYAIHPVLHIQFTEERFIGSLDIELNRDVVEYHTNPPPPIAGRERLLKKQHWLI